MAISNFPTSLQPIIQQGWLEHAFEQPLVARLGYREIADREQFMSNVGESITKTRVGLLPVSNTPLNPAAISPLAGAAATLDNGMTPVAYGVEQYSISLNQYGTTMNLNTVTQRVGIEKRFVQNAKALGENAMRSMDTLARDSLFAGYMTGNTSVRVASTTTAVSVDDVRGFLMTAVNGISVSVGGGVNLAVLINGNAYTVNAAVADSTNVSRAYNGVSGILTLSAAVASADGAAGNAVVSATASQIVRPNGRTTYGALTTTDLLSMANILDAKAALDSNAVPDIDGFYNCYLDPTSARQLFADADFKQLFQGATSEQEVFRGGSVTSPFLGIRFVRTTNAPVQAHPTIANHFVRRPIICGMGALIEGDFDQTPDDTLESAELITVNGVIMTTRPPLDRLQQVITQSWSWIGGYCAPSDLTTNSQTLPTATNAQYKRAVVIEHFG